MDVACPRCSTEYEFDETRIPVDGVTVKCTQCSHVFRIKKRASAFTTEVSQPGRDWKLRRLDGRVEAFQKLTTLHQWIVERRVSRNDEVSLTGETWKRLGDIAELASFFMIVDEAERSRNSRGEVKTQPEAYTQPAAPAPVPAPAPAPAPAMPPPLPPHAAHPPHEAPNPKETLRGGQFAPLPPPASAAKTLPPDAPDPLKETLRQPAFGAPPPPPTDMTPAPQPQPPAPPRAVTLPPSSMRVQSAARGARPRPMPSDEELFAAAKGSSGAGKWLGLLLLLAGLGGAAGYYFVVWQPQQLELARQRQAEADAAALKQAEADKAAAEAKAKQEEEEKKRLEEEEAKKAAELAAKDAGAPDAGLAMAPDAGEKPVVKAPVRDFDQWMALGDRLRSADKAEAALNAYGEAADLKPERVEPVAGRGLALLDMGKQLQAEASFQQAIKLNNHYGPALMGLAETYRYMNKSDKALEYYQKYLDVLPDGPESNVARTQIERLKKAP